MLGRAGLSKSLTDMRKGINLALTTWFLYLFILLQVSHSLGNNLWRADRGRGN